MLYETPQDWRNANQKRVAFFGMSGLGKTHASNLLRASSDWFHYSVDYRIGTRYMGEHIVDNFKREAMRNPFLRELMLQDSIYIASNITFENLAPLSTYLGKPGDPNKGGIPFKEYVARQRQHRVAEIKATLDAIPFADKAKNIYGYNHFVGDTSGSLCEVVDPTNPEDPVLKPLSQYILPIWLKGTEAHIDTLADRFDKSPKPMYYKEDFLHQTWAEYCDEHDQNEASVDPDQFIRWGYRKLLHHRLPVYEAMAKNWGITIEANDLGRIRDTHDFEGLVADALAMR